MQVLKIDYEKLAFGLERGIGNTRTIFASLEPHERLRITPCGLVSSAIHAYATRQGIDSMLAISNPQLDFDPKMQHVIPLLGHPDHTPTVVDASPSQFLTYVGLNIAYTKCIEEDVFPEEKVIGFKLDEREHIVQWLTTAATVFQKINRRPRDHLERQLGVGPLSDASPATIQAVYDKIWHPKNLTSWTPADYVLEDGRVASLDIPKDTIIG